MKSLTAHQQTKPQYQSCRISHTSSLSSAARQRQADARRIDSLVRDATYRALTSKTQLNRQQFPQKTRDVSLSW